MPSRDELLIIARLKNEVSRPIQDVNRDLNRLTKEVQAADKATGAQVRQLRALGREAKATTLASKELGERWAENGRRLTMFLSLPLLAGLGAAAKAASNLAEAQSKANVVFGASVPLIRTLSADSARALGLSARAVEEAAGSFGALFTPLGIGKQRAAEMSAELVKLSADLSSFYNARGEDALVALRAGLVGETEPLRRYGVQLSATRLEQEAYAAGIAETGQKLNAAQKAQAAYRIILQDTVVAQGDFERTADGAANSVRKAQAAIENAGASIGQKLTPAVAKAAQMVAGLAEAFRALPGPVSTAIVALATIGIVAGPILFVVGRLKALSASLKLAEMVGRRLGPTLVRSLGLAAKGLGLVTAAYTALNFVAGRRNERAGSFVEKLVGDKDLGTVAGLKDALVELRREREKLGDRPGRLRVPGLGLDITASAAAADKNERIKALDKSIKTYDAQLKKAEQSTKDMRKELGGAAGAMGGFADETLTAEQALQKFDAAWQTALGRFLDADDAALKAKAAIESLAETLRDKDATSSDRAADVIAVTRAIQQTVQADAEAGRIAGGVVSMYQAQIDRLRKVRDQYPAIRGQLDAYVAKLQEAQRTEVVTRVGLNDEPALAQLARLKSLVDAQEFEATLGFRAGEFNFLGVRVAIPAARRKVVPIGDTPRPKGADGASLDMTLARASLASAGVPGQRYITSGLRDFALGSPDSDHATGRALDVVGANLGGFADAIRRAGGFAEFHGSGAARHLHTVPVAAAPTGALSPSRGGRATTIVRNHTPVTIHVHNPSAGIDVERAIERGLERAERNSRERGKGRR